MFRPRARYFCRDTKVPKRSPGLRARTRESPKRKMFRKSGVPNLVPLLLHPGLRPWIGKDGKHQPLNDSAWLFSTGMVRSGKATYRFDPVA